MNLRNGSIGPRDILRSIYRALHVRATLFYEDLQRGGIVNWHRRVAEFAFRHPSPERVLDLGSGARRLPGVIAFDIDLTLRPAVQGDAHRLPFATSSFDAVIVQQVLEHVVDPRRVVDEIARALKPGGSVYCEVPFVYPVHDSQDFHRWTEAGLRILFEGFIVSESGPAMGPFSALSVMLRQMLSSWASPNAIRAAIDLAAGWLLWPIKQLDRFFHPQSATLGAAAVYLIAEKPHIEGAPADTGAP